MWPLDEASSSTAKWITGIIGGLAIAWKIFLRVRRDAREDGAADAVTESFELVDKGQRAEITRLHVSLHEIAERLRNETTMRYQAETEIAIQRRRADVAEAAAEHSARRTHAANEAVELFRAQIKVLEMDNARLTQEKIDRGDNPFSPSVDR